MKKESEKAGFKLNIRKLRSWHPVPSKPNEKPESQTDQKIQIWRSVFQGIKAKWRRAQVGGRRGRRKFEVGGFCRGFLKKGQLDSTEAGGTRGERKGAPPDSETQFWPNGSRTHSCLVGR